MSHFGAIPMHVNPQLGPGLDALSLWCEDNHYSQHARERILAHAAAEGTPTGSVYLEAEDEAEATEAFVSALPAVPTDDPAWDRGDVVLDARMLADNNHPLPFGDEPDDADRSIPGDAVIVPPELEPDDWHDAPDASPFLAFPGRRPPIERMPPISGGAPDETYEPTPPEWEAACAMFRDEPADEMREWYRRNPLERFNGERAD